MTTLLAARQRMLQLEPRVLGRVITPSAFAAQTITATELAVGTITSGAWGGVWALRPTSATSADRVRLITATGYTASTGVLTHAGTAYSDTTVGTEQVELHRFEPYLLELMIQEALRSIRRLDTVHFQMRPDGRYDLVAYPWLDEPSLISRFGKRAIETLTPNRHLTRWGTVSTAGVLQPDNFTLAGTSATFARSTTSRRDPYSLSVTRSGTDATVSITIPVRYSDAPDDDLRGEIVTAALVARSAQASSVRVRVTSETASGLVLATTNSSYHTGGGAFEELTAIHTVDAAAEQVTTSARVEVNEAALLDELYLAHVNGITDNLRRDDVPVTWFPRPYDYQQNPLLWLAPSDGKGRGQQMVLESRRPYPILDATRLASGSADSDVTDAPLDLLAHKALALFFAARQTENARMAALAEKYAKSADDLQKQHLLEPPQSGNPGAPVMHGPSYGRRAAIR